MLYERTQRKAKLLLKIEMRVLQTVPIVFFLPVLYAAYRGCMGTYDLEESWIFYFSFWYARVWHCSCSLTHGKFFVQITKQGAICIEYYRTLCRHRHNLSISNWPHCLRGLQHVSLSVHRMHLVCGSIYVWHQIIIRWNRSPGYERRVRTFNAGIVSKGRWITYQSLCVRISFNRCFGIQLIYLFFDFQHLESTELFGKSDILDLHAIDHNYYKFLSHHDREGTTSIQFIHYTLWAVFSCRIIQRDFSFSSFAVSGRVVDIRIAIPNIHRFAGFVQFVPIVLHRAETTFGNGWLGSHNLRGGMG